MAAGNSNLGGLKVSLGLNSAQFTQSLTDVNRRLKAVRSEFDAASDGTKDYAKSLDGLEAKQDMLNRSMELNQAKANELRRRYNELAQSKGEDNAETIKALTAYNKHLGVMNKTEAQLRQVNRAIEEHGDKVKGLGNHFEGLRERIKGATDRIGQFGSSFKDFGASFKDFGKRVGTATGTVAKLGTALTAVGSVAAPLAGVMGSLASSVASAGAGAGLYAAVAIPAITKVTEAVTDLEEAQKKVDEAENAEDRKKALEEMAQVTAGFSEEQLKAVKSMQDFKSFFADELSPQFEKPIFTAFSNGLDFAKRSLELSAPIIHSVADAVTGLTEDLKNSLGSPEVRDIFNWLKVTAGDSVTALGQTFGYAIQGVGSFLAAFSPASVSVQDGLLKMTKGFADWAAGLTENDRFKAFMDYAKENAPKLKETFSGIMTVIGDVFQVVAPIFAAATSALLTVGSHFSEFYKKFQLTGTEMSAFKDTVINGFNELKAFVKPAVDAVASVVSGMIKRIKTYWDENGAQIIQSAKTTFGNIKTTVADAITTAAIFVRDKLKQMKAFWDENGAQIMTTASTIFNKIKNVVVPAISEVATFVRDKLQQMKTFWDENGTQIMTTASTIFNKIKEVVIPAISEVATFVGEKIREIKAFWDKDGAQFMTAVTNVFKGIAAIVQFVMPVVLEVIKMVWGNIKGVIDGGLKVIQGAIQVFSGIFTGDFSKIWEGIKNIFTGGIKAAWNLFQLMFIGRIFKAVKGFATGFVGFLKGGWTKAVEGVRAFASGISTRVSTLWTNLTTNVRNFATNFVNRLKTGWTNAVTGIQNFATTIFNRISTAWSNIMTTVRNFASNLVARLKDGWSNAINGIKNFATNGVNRIKDFVDGGKRRFNDLVTAAKGLPKRIGDGIGKMASKAGAGMKKLANELLSGLGKGVNGVIGGINWVLGKIGVDDKNQLPKWTVPQYKNGTEGHQGGLAVLGDGKKKELYVTPQGHAGLSPATDTLMNLPQGTRVFSGEQTKELMNSGFIPKYKFGNIGDLWSGIKNVGSKAVGKVKEFGGDILDVITNPAKAMKKVYDHYIGNLPNLGSGGFGKILGSSISLIKDKAASFIKGKVEGMGSSGGGAGFGSGAMFSGSGATMARTAISTALAMLGKSQAFLPGLMKVAFHESGYNPNAINDWDINAQRGDPSIGLFQIIGSTFKRWMYPGHGNRRNPLDSALAAIRYLDGRYGGIENHPGLRSMASGGGYRPYAKGGIVTKPHMGLVGEAGDEAIIPIQNYTEHGRRLWLQAGQRLGMLSTGTMSAPSSSGSTVITNNYNFHFENASGVKEVDMKQFVSDFETERTRKENQMNRSLGLGVR